MVATTMQKISSLVKKLASTAASREHLAKLSFRESELFSWNHSTKVISFNPTEQDADKYLLHEFGHALLNHQSYTRDVELLKMERDAWREALIISELLGIVIDQEFVDEAIDSYRDWLHARSLCPNCNTTGIQTDERSYRCLSCSNTWTVNEARSCALRRYSTKKHLS